MLDVDVASTYPARLLTFTSDGISEITETVSEPFEVFSPKLFKGMHESTQLTRHLATQGLKVKLRTDPPGGKGASRRRASSQAARQQQHVSPPGDVLSPAPHSAPGQSSHVRYSQGMPAGPGSAPPYAQPQRGLVWPGHFPSPYPGYPEYDSGGRSSARRSPGAPVDEPARKMRRTHDDGGYGAHDISSRLDLSCESMMAIS